MIDWLAARWVIAAAVIAGVMLILAPVVAASLPLWLTYLCSPVYMIHQVEEHWHDRFRQFVDGRLFDGRPVLTRRDILIVNVPLVWGVNAAALAASALVSPAFGLVAGYAMLVNAVGHGAMAVRMRCYNPGLASAIFLFVPLGAAIAIVTPASLSAHLAAFGGAVLLHLGVAALALRRVAGQAIPAARRSTAA